MTVTDMFDLRGRRAAVIGGTGVLGSQFCRTLADAGAHVFVMGRSAARGADVVRDIEGADGTAEFVAVDATDRASLAHAAVRLGDHGLDILVNSAGVNSSTPFPDITDDEWDRIQDIDLHAVFRACQVFAPLMANREVSASIINISSASASPPLSRVLAYGVAKAGVDNLTRYLARELAPQGIRVNALVPGFFPAEQNRALLTQERVDDILRHTPLRRLGEPAELAGAIAWLASSRASGFVTGALIRVDGGFGAMTI